MALLLPVQVMRKCGLTKIRIESLLFAGDQKHVTRQYIILAYAIYLLERVIIMVYYMLKRMHELVLGRGTRKLQGQGLERNIISHTNAFGCKHHSHDVQSEKCYSYASKLLP